MTMESLHALGGVGLFLLGMVVMSEGLKSLAGEFLHRVLTRFTQSPASGVATGVASTAILQSSSATTVAAVGFVGAGLLSFPQALGIIFGANLGTTVTGWMVAILGFRLQLGELVLPPILLGVLLRLFGRGRLPAAGYALAGFGLVFVGIEFLQQGMAALEGVITPERFPADDLLGRLQLVLLGGLITLVTQSSSAGVATALAAVYTGTIGFSQAAALVIGMDVGTTVTAAMATLGGSVDTRRTGYSHVIYNVFTGVGAFVLLGPYVWLCERFAPELVGAQAEIGLVAFHSGFNLLGVVIVIPLTGAFTRLLVRLVPEPALPALDRLDRKLLAEPEVALRTAGQTLQELAQGLLSRMLGLLGSGQAGSGFAGASRVLGASQGFLDGIHLTPDNPKAWGHLNAAVHALDHLQRLHDRFEEEPERARMLREDGVFSDWVDAETAHLRAILQALVSEDWSGAERLSGHWAQEVAEKAEAQRTNMLNQVAMGSQDVMQGTDRLEAIRWLRRSSYHVWRICLHLAVLRAED